MARKLAFTYDCAVIGAGPGGLVTALYLARFRRKVALIGDGKPRVLWGPRIRNLVGYDRGVSGRTLLKRLIRQIDRVGGVDWFHCRAKVSRIPGPGGGFNVNFSTGECVTARTVVLATGITDKQPEIENVNELRRLALLKYCSICDGFEVRDHPIAVLAADDMGLQKALFLSAWTRNAVILVPKDFRPAPQRLREIRQARMKLVPTMRFSLEAIETPRGHALCVSVGGKKRPFICSVAYVELGCEVNDDAFRDIRGIRRSKEGFIITTQEQRTSIPGLFAVGDCVNLLGQVGVAAGQAAVAATTIHNDLLP
jgi:thioredoxin reductase (NADPH)